MQTTRNEQQKNQRFINHWQTHLGVQDFLRYQAKFVWIGLMLAPIVMTLINHNIWRQISVAGWANAWFAILFMGGVFAVLPTLIVGIIFWRNGTRRYHELTTGKARYLPMDKRMWLPEEARWRKALGVLTALMGVSLFMGLGLVLGHNAPEFYAYPLELSLLYLMIWSAFEGYLFIDAQHNDQALSIPLIFKIALCACGTAVGVAWLVVLWTF